MSSKVESKKKAPVSGHRETYLDFQGNLCVAFTLFALGYIAAHYALQLYFPVIYIWVSTEDSWVEYGTFAAFALTAFLVGRLALQPGAWRRRAIWAIIAVVAALVALDEISWGQRIIGLRPPEPLLEIKNAPTAAPPIIIISKGRDFRIIPNFPPAKRYPPKTMAKITTIPTMPITTQMPF